MIRKLKEFRFSQMARSIRNTPEICYQLDDSVVIISMVSSNTVDMYLIALKSFMKNFGYGTIEVVDDGSLTQNDYALLEAHIPHVTFFKANDVETYDCPSYVSWKRLFRAQKLSEKSFVIQLDSDTISLGPLVDVHNKVQRNEGFLTGSKRWATAVDPKFLNRIVSQWDYSHVQPSAEVGFLNIDFFKDGTTYLRGCAGFAGYPKGFASIDEIRKLSSEIESYVGPRWKKWGSEQTASMCLISKCQGSDILPWPYYQNFGEPKCQEYYEYMNLIHFIGTYRFNDNVYYRLANKFIKSLK